ncbi:MAG: hypothetical protein WKF94_10800 [Solirubrobacteraceae bacterium]
MLARRLLMFAVILLVVTAISTALAPPPQPTSPPPVATDAPSSARASRNVARTIDASRQNPTTVEVEAGDLLTLTVSSDEAGAVELRELGQVKVIDPTTDAVFDVLPTQPGRYAVVLLGSERTVGTVRVTPRQG